MTDEQKAMARHALGLPNKAKKSYRNRYVCPEDEPTWVDLVAKGMATMRPAASVPFGGNAIFYLTALGAKAALNRGEKLCSEDFPERLLTQQEKAGVK